MNCNEVRDIEQHKVLRISDNRVLSPQTLQGLGNIAEDEQERLLEPEHKDKGYNTQPLQSQALNHYEWLS